MFGVGGDRYDRFDRCNLALPPGRQSREAGETLRGDLRGDRALREDDRLCAGQDEVPEGVPDREPEDASRGFWLQSTIDCKEHLGSSCVYQMTLQSDVVLGGYTVPEGTTVIRVGHMTSNDACNFKNPEKFLPERWLRDSAERHSAHPFANIPWGHGARSICSKRIL